ncbi:flavodoxin domain-containing protein [Anaeromicrobium sediminis]|uniref:flavodoxin domain-containing protein n=1 Tax=Anaeromicrobium sediminis TaxID=1478221 RepID=UPI0015956383|nr:flavodoxin domain-containing protein [Anaeromicrobium sediminis]
MKSALIIYESRYGTTKDVARNLSYIIKNAHICKASEFHNNNRDYDLVIIGAPVYYDNLDERIYKFIEDNILWLKTKDIMVFCTCMSLENKHIYLKKIYNMLNKNIINTKALGGKIIINNLDKLDYYRMKNFTRINEMALNDMDNYDLKKIVEYGQYIKKIMNNELIEHEVR